MRKAMLYIHGKGGSAEECGHVCVLANSIGTSLAIKCRAKDIYGMNLFEMRLPETERR